MKKIKAKEELKAFDEHQLREKLELYRKEYFKLKLDAANAQVKDSSQFKKLRNNIARTLTFLKKRAEVTK